MLFLKIYSIIVFVHNGRIGFVNNISLISLVKIAIRHFYILVISALVCGIAAFSFCQFVAVPVYSATGSVLVTNGAIIKDNIDNNTGSSKVSNTDISASLQLANTITDILKTNDIYKELADNTGNKYTYSELKSKISVKRRSTDTLFIDIAFTGSTPEEAKSLTNKFLELAPDYILKFIPNSTAAVTTNAESALRIYPRTSVVSLAAAFIGAVISFAIVYLISLANTTIKTESDITDNYKIMLIGNIPDFSNAKSKGYYKYGKYGYSRKDDQ